MVIEKSLTVNSKEVCWDFLCVLHCVDLRHLEIGVLPMGNVSLRLILKSIFYKPYYSFKLYGKTDILPVKKFYSVKLS